MEFSKSTIEQIGYYVYRLIDPRNGKTFYVGKGKGNRVFQHVKGAIDYYDGIKNKDHDYADDPNKLRVIQEIRNAGLEVIHIIQRWHLSEDQAFEVEAAIIDCFQGLSNIQSGHGSFYGVCNAAELENRLAAKFYDEPNFGYVIIKVQNWKMDEMIEKFGIKTARYEATRGCWHNKKPNIEKYPYIFSVTNGIVRAIYKVTEWHNVGDRIECSGTDVSESLGKDFIGKRIPPYYSKKGMASPFLLSKNV